MEEPVVNYQGRKISRASGIARRQQILTATLRIIINDGMRGVRHRAVAHEAQVPLAATTYYFKSLEDLITASFIYWAEQNNLHSAKFRETCFAALVEFEGVSLADKAVCMQLAKQICKLTADHICQQVLEHEDDRILELAFRHEAFRNERLKEVVFNQEQSFLRDLVQFHQLVGSIDPIADAQISLSLIFGLEQAALMKGVESLDKSHIERTVRRHIYAVFDVR